jgi:RNA-binding protein 39
LSSEKNRTNDATDRLVHSGDKGPMRLYVGSLHVNITEEMLRGIFEPFGRIQSLSLTRDQVIRGVR